MDDAKGSWVELIPKILWSSHTMMQSTTKENSFSMVYGVDTRMTIKIETLLWRWAHFDEEANEIGLNCAADLIDELWKASHAREFFVKHEATKRYNSKVMSREMQEGNLVLKEVVIRVQQGKL